VAWRKEKAERRRAKREMTIKEGKDEGKKGKR